MCGIAGIYQNPNTLKDTEILLRKMLSRIRYRGPDESGIYMSNKMALGSVRLSIVDLQSGQQPLYSPDRKY